MEKLIIDIDKVLLENIRDKVINLFPSLITLHPDFIKYYGKNVFWLNYINDDFFFYSEYIKDEVNLSFCISGYGIDIKQIKYYEKSIKSTRMGKK